MPSFFDDPYKMQYLGTLGMGLMQAAQPQPPGANRMSYVANAMQAANQNMMQSRLFNMQMEEAQEKRAERKSRQEALSTLIGGPDPTTDITWDTGRQGLMDDQKLSLLAQASPEAFTQGMMGQMFREPESPQIIKDAEGYNRYTTGPNAGKRVFEDVRKTVEPKNVQAITLENQKTGETVTLSRADPNLKNYLQPGSGWVEAPRTRQGALSASRVDDINADMGALNRARQRLAKIRTDIVENRNRAGITGTASRWVQEGLGMAQDLTGIGIDVPGVVGETMQDVQNDLNSGLASEGVAGYFDPSIPKNEVFENSLAYALARARKGPGRLNKDDVENARKDVRITGLTSTEAVLSRLAAIDQEFEEAQNDLQSRLGGAQGVDIPTYAIINGKLVRQ